MTLRTSEDWFDQTEIILLIWFITGRHNFADNNTLYCNIWKCTHIVNISSVCRSHRCVLVIEMSWGPYQKCLILCWFHRGIGFLQMEQPFTRSLRAPAPAVIGSHDIWSVGMTRVWQRRGGTVFIPIVSQTLLTVHLGHFFLHLFCVLQTFLRASNDRDQTGWQFSSVDWDQEQTEGEREEETEIAPGLWSYRTAKCVWRDTTLPGKFLRNKIFSQNISLWDLQTSWSKIQWAHCRLNSKMHVRLWGKLEGAWRWEPNFSG